MKAFFIWLAVSAAALGLWFKCQADCAGSKCPAGTAGRLVRDAGCICVPVPEDWP